MTPTQPGAGSSSALRALPGAARDPRAGIDPGIRERFELLTRVGVGGMGQVWRARERSSGRLVALKLLASDDGDVPRFRREAAVMASIDHPGVVRHLGEGVSPAGARYLVMEWLSGEALDARLAQRPLALAETLALGVRLADALGAAHRAGIIHRDVKPANVVLVGGRAEGAKLVDFGLARRTLDPRLTAPGVVVGTPGYMAPEQLRCEPLDARVDVHGLGCLLFECLTGRAPFEGANLVAVSVKVLSARPPRVGELRPGVPAALEALVARMLEKDRALRPADGGAVADALREIQRASAPTRGLGWALPWRWGWGKARAAEPCVDPEAVTQVAIAVTG